MDTCPESVLRQLAGRMREGPRPFGFERSEVGTSRPAPGIKKERARRDYYNFFTLGNWGVAANYDLCLDSSLVGLEGCVDIIVDFGRKAGLL